MKKLLALLILCLGLNLNAQDSEKQRVKATIIKFFEAFHKQDTTTLKAMAKGDIKLQSISVNREGQSVLSESEYGQFLKSIASIPAENTFEEKLLSFNIQVDGNMANAWTPYEFWYNGNFSHCGVNSFQLMKGDNEWKIIYLVDTRRREGCQDHSKN
ncbi:nuclear transport factor 2 family protein [Winogradskyella aquimaris]|uniref:Nuclear transport factor 2 family protein n=1 Tax=Winogradskyella aquimaris TaxID=864074 RepID=A0ABU5ES35_9FLAO|nr:nuclear transport factor 2 family protein [Winogradskyella aquimaris]MDY2587579.1 nuclear transport factor 2 family protein [Winogradskyella aquimaris]